MVGPHQSLFNLLYENLLYLKKSLDDLHALLYKNYAGAKSGYTSYNVRQLLKQMTGDDFSQFWQDYVEGVKAIDFDELLDFYGLQIEKPVKKAK